jgi:uncharacterized alpha/beta hydrolase family protein
VGIVQASFFLPVVVVVVVVVIIIIIIIIIIVIKTDLELNNQCWISGRASVQYPSSYVTGIGDSSPGVISAAT